MLYKDTHELTNAQKSIWLTEQYLKGTSIGNISGIVHINQKIDIEKLKISINEFILRNDSIRTKILIKNGVPYQYFSEHKKKEIKINEVNSKKEAETLLKKLATIPLKLLESDLFDFSLYLLPNGNGGILITIHHLIGDAWTAGLIVTGIMDIYESLINTNNLNENCTYSYVNYINSEKDYLNSPKFEKDKVFWNTIFDSIPAIAEIPSKKVLSLNTNSINYKSQRNEYLLSKDLVDKINIYCKNCGISIFNFFMAIYAIYIERVCSIDDFIIGSPILNRSNFKEKQATGMFISTIPYRISIDDTLSFSEFVKNLAKQSMQIFRHQKYPYQNILQDLRKINPNIPNLYNFLISYQNIRSDKQTNTINYEAKWFSNGNVSDSINIHLYDMNDFGSLNVAYEYQVEKYSSSDISSMHSRILEIINQIIGNYDILLKDIEILSLDDRKNLNFSNNKLQFKFCESIYEQIVSNSKGKLNNIAIETALEKITYKELFERVNKLANFLLNLNLAPNSNIGVFTNRTIDVIVGILAILKIGSTYVPIDPEYPKSRINYMVDKANLNFILTDNLDNYNLLENKDINLINIKYEVYSSEITVFNKNIEYDLNQNLYIVFTSGSTGNPKGITISHKNMLNLIYFQKEKTDLLKGQKRILQFATMSFDVSYQEIYSALLSNSTLVLVNEAVRKDIYKLTNYILEKQIDTLFIPPAYLRLLTESSSNVNKFKKYVKNIITAGEQLVITKGIKSLILAGIKVHNHYGPAETHVATTYVVDKNNIELKPPIGMPISNCNVFILDKYNKICPVYTIGQIAICGDCVGNGYFNNEELTNEKFVSFYNQPTYLTGDLGYLDEYNCVHYLGRQDFQVKINGFRIELEEIDKVFCGIKGVQNVVTTVLEKDNKKHIVSYYTLNDSVSEDDIYAYLKQKLPAYMMPAKIVRLDSFPLTMNGKVDKKALPKVNLLDISKDFIEPKTEMELKFAKIWKEIFNTNKISTNYDFFSIGGDSLLAIKLSAKIQDVFNVDISVKDIFQTPVFSDLLNLINMGKQNSFCKIPVSKRAEFYPLSSAQKRIFYADSSIGDDSIVYNLPGGILVNEVLDFKRVENAFNVLIEKHSSFRTSFKLVNNKPMQFIEKNIKINLKLNYDKCKNLRNIINAFPKSFDLSKAPLLHAQMYILDNEKTLILMDTHHIIVDGTSLDIIVKDFCDIYNGSFKEDFNAISYKDFAVFENNFKYNESIENYWISKFKDREIPVLNLPYDFSRPVMKSYNGYKVSRHLVKSDFEKYENLAKLHGFSPFMFFVTAFLIVLYKYTNQNELIIGTPAAGRDYEELQNLVGMFVNNIVLDNFIDENFSVLDLLTSVKKTTLDGLSYQPYPYDRLVKKLNLKKDISRNPLFDVMFIYQNMPSNKTKLCDKSIKFVECETNISKFDLSLEIIPSSCTVNIEYCTDLFKKHTVISFLEHYLQTLEMMYENLEQKVKDICILTNKEKKFLLDDFNDTYLKYPQNETISTLFEKQVRISPKDIALVYHESSLSYEQLNEKANSLANYLRSLGIGRNDIVSIMLPRSLELIIAMIAVLKAGASYIPIDYTYPKNRIEYMLNNSKCKFLLTFKDLSNFVKFENKVFVELTNSQIYCLDKNNLLNINEPLDMSYIIYTSGSTGFPKGVVLNHKALVNLCYYLNDYVDFLKYNRPSKTIVSVTTASFDIFIFETLVALQKGLKVVIADEEEQKSPALLNNLINSQNVEIIQMTPSRMQFLIDNIDDIPSISKLKYVVLAGEPLPKNLLNTLKRYGIKKVYNGYGPSETTVFSTFTDVTEHRTVTIGKPLANTKIYLLDKDLNLVPKGVVGEIYISGDGVGNGYLNNIDLTNKSFLPNPFENNSVMYRTGDSAKLLPNGELCYIERLDNQVKVRGLRIELDEIESKILSFPGIQKVKVVKQSIQNREFISAYFVANVRIRISELRTYLYKQLPNYMIPSYFTALDDFPYTPNGKIDKKALPLPNAINIQAEKIEKPKTTMQKKLVDLFEKILNVSPIGITDNFFELGGDSILAMQLHIELLKYNSKITYADIFSNPTVLDLSNLFTKAKSSKGNSSSLVAINDDLKYSYQDLLKSCLKLPKIFEYKSPKNVLISGVTGFLGIHILDSFLQNETGNAYCLIRNEPGLTAHIKLLNKLHFYFGNKYDNLIDKRIFVVKSDITNENLGLNNKDLSNLISCVDTVINCAAKVSHYGSYDSFYKINVTAVENLINFCINNKKTFYQISTLSVSGNSFVDQYRMEENISRKTNFTEGKFYIGQNLNNVYIRTKFEAENKVLSAIENGLNGYILRVGNLMPRFVDGKFQQNSSENAYINRLLGFLQVGCIPDNLLDSYLEFTPIDFTANSIIKLISYPSLQNRVFHIFNDNYIKIPEILSLLKLYNYIIDVVDEDTFKTKIKNILDDESQKYILNNLINDFDENLNLSYKTNIILKCELTKKYLEHIGFTWPKIDSNYVKYIIDCIESLRKNDNF